MEKRTDYPPVKVTVMIDGGFFLKPSSPLLPLYFRGKGARAPQQPHLTLSVYFCWHSSVRRLTLSPSLDILTQPPTMKYL